MVDRSNLRDRSNVQEIDRIYGLDDYEYARIDNKHLKMHPNDPMLLFFDGYGCVLFLMSLWTTGRLNLEVIE